MALSRLLAIIVLACVASSAHAQAAADEMLFWESVRNSKSAVELQAYLDRWPDGVYAPIARNRIAEINGKRATTVSRPPRPVASVSAVPEIGHKLFVLTPAAVERSATANENIKRECIDGVKPTSTANYQGNSPPGSEPPVLAPLPTEVATQTARFLSKKVTVEEIRDLAKAGDAQVLRLMIVDIEGKMGGIFSGRKSMTVEAELVQNGKVLGTADFTRRTTVAAFVGPDTCLALSRAASAIGKDVADWLTQVPARPNSNAGAPAPAR